MRDVLDAIRTDATEAERRRAENRARWPEIAAVKDALGDQCRVLCVHEGDRLVMGREPPPDPDSWAVLTGDCVVALCSYGSKK